MRKCIPIFQLKTNFLFVIILLCIGFSSKAQQPTISDYVLFGGKVITGQSTPASPGYGVVLGSSTTVQGGSIGSYFFISSTGNSTLNANIYSGGKIQLANSNVISGKITAANSSSLTGTILSIGSSTNIGGNIDVMGNIAIGGGTVSGRVTHPVGTTYTGPTPGGGNIIGVPVLPDMPTTPDITNYPDTGTVNFTSTQTIIPGNYGNIILSGNRTITLSGTGIYVFKSIKNSGNSNNFIFDFKGDPTGTFKIFVTGDVDVNKVQANLANGGSATRIYTEIHGKGLTSSNGSTAFNMANGSAGQNSKWLGSIWAPFGSINIGSGTGSSNLTGALWSGTQVNLQSGVQVIYAPFNFCTAPNANAGPDKPLDFVNQTTLTGSSTSSDVTYSWRAINGGVITTPLNAAQISISAAGSYIFTVSNGSCSASDTAIVTGKINDIIGSELQSVFQNYDPNAPESPFFRIQNDSIFIDVITKEGKYSEALTQLTSPAFGLRSLLSNGSSNFIITGSFPIAKLPLLNTLGALVVYCRPYYGAFHNSGITSSAGDSSVRAHLVRNGYGLLGEGIKVGVLSDSYNTITAASTNPISNTAIQDISNGDLPGATNPFGYTTPVQVLKDYPFRSTDEGRGMLQIVHDLAPAAGLYFRTGFISPGDFALGIDELRQAGCKVMVDDITFITEPFLQDGVVAKAVDQASAAGVSYFSAAGNFANKSYENSFNPTPLPGGQPGSGHNFGGGDMFQSVTLAPGNYTIVLQWLDDIYSLGQTSTGGTKNDLDIYLTPNTDGTALFGFNRNNTNGDPIEILPFTITATTTTNIFIRNNTVGSNPGRFKVVAFRGEITFNEYNTTGASTVTGQANAAGAITVGAARYDKVSPYPGPLAIESFSSIGGTTVNGVKRNKPDLTAPDGINTTVNLGGDYDHDNFSNFFGTSAAAPHAAAVAALIMEGKKKFANQLLVSPAEIRSLLQSTATDMNTPGFDFSSGYGFINVDSAMRTFAKPDPSLIQLVVPQNITPGGSAFTLTITGLNLSSTSVVKFRDSTLTTNIINSTTGTAEVPAFVGDPIISVYTPPSSTSGLDGGTSETLKFFNLPKRNVVVIADSKKKKYAEVLPVLTATILINGDTLKNTNLTLADLGLDSLKLTTAATSMSDVGTYAITASRKFVSTNPVDIGLQELYNYTFTPANFTIEQLPVTITAQNNTITYGEKIPDVQFTYSFDGAHIADSVAFLNSLIAAHQSQLAKDEQGNDILGLVNGEAVTIVNGEAIPIVNGEAVTIVNGEAVTIVNGEAIPIVNDQAITIVNGEAVTIVNHLTGTQVQNLSFLVTTPSLQNARLIKNKTLLNGTYQKDSTKVVDITQESILDFIVNSAQTYMLNSLSRVSAKGLIDIESFTNGEAVTIVNGEAVTIVNGEAVTIVNGEAVTIVNGEAVTIVNGEAVPIVNSQNKTAVIVDSSEIGKGQSQLKSLNMITGLDVGNQFIIPGSLRNNNLLVISNAGHLNVLAAPVTITPTAGLTKVYGAEDPAFTFTNNAGLAAGEFQGQLSRVGGNNVGSYSYTLGNLTAGANYSLSLSTTAPVPSFTITTKPVIITANPGQSKIYGSPDPVFTFTNNGSVTNFTGSLSRVAGQNTGTFAYTIGTLSAGMNYNLTLANVNTFSITQAALLVKANDKVIVNGDPQPTNFSSIITGLKYSDNPTITYTVSPVYSGLAGEYGIIPLISSTFVNAFNYNISYINGTLYVNPEGPGTKKLRPGLDCVVEVPNPQPGQFRYIARYFCINDNSQTVYVAIGSENNIRGGSFDASAQPVVFRPGITRFEVPFDGSRLTWTLRTFDSDHKTSVGSEASSSSSKCSNTLITTNAARMMEMESTSLELEASKTNVYPNPATNRIIVNDPTVVLNEKNMSLYNANGIMYQAKMIRRVSANSVELDISGLPAGFYLIRCKIANGYKTFRFVKG